MSDADWRWHSDLPYYVENYRVALPEEFLKRMRTMNFQIDREAVQKKLENYEE